MNFSIAGPYVSGIRDVGAAPIDCLDYIVLVVDFIPWKRKIWGTVKFAYEGALVVCCLART